MSNQQDPEVVSTSVGQIGITLREPPALAMISCGPVISVVGPISGKRFFDELTKIREALVAAQKVLVERTSSGYAATPAEVHLARKLVELEVQPDYGRSLDEITEEAIARTKVTP